MQIVRFEVGGMMGSNAYLIFDEDTKDAVIFDPGFPDERYMQVIEENGLNLNKIILTHGHFDHIGGVQELREKTGAVVYVPEEEKGFLISPNLNLSSSAGMPAIQIKPAEETVADGDVIEISPGNTVTALLSPGHTPGSTCYVGDDFIVSGDVLFEGSIGRTDFPGGSFDQMQRSLDKLMEFPDEMVVLPGHGNITTIGQERRNNYFLR